MRSIEVIISDAKTGKDLGVVNSYDGVYFDEGVDILLPFVYFGYYYPFTNNPKNPIDTNKEHVVVPKAGQYELKMIGTDDNGKQYISRGTSYILLAINGVYDRHNNKKQFV